MTRTDGRLSRAPAVVGGWSSPGRSENGSLTVFILIFCVTLFILIGLVVDSGRAISARSATMSEAEQAARAGAGQISVGALRVGQVEVDPASAIRASTEYLASAEPTASVLVTVVGETVTVHITTAEPTVILGIIGIDRIGISVTASATDLHGVTQED